MPLAISDLAAFLGGSWRIDRRIADQNAGITGRLHGTAHFEPAPGGLHYAETGALTLGDYQGEASRRYWYGLGAPDQAAIWFDDGSPFHPLDLTTGLADITHACAPDLYRGRYRVQSITQWTVVWLIQGPRKQLRIGTRYRRAG